MLPDGPAGTRFTLKEMAAEIRAGRESMAVRQMAETLVRNLPQKDYLGEIKAIHAFVRDRVRYTRDIRQVELLHTAERLLQSRQGDCDDKSILVCALLESVGHKTGLIAIGPRKGAFSHVFALVADPRQPGGFMPLECTEPWPAGVSASMVSNMIEWV